MMIRPFVCVQTDVWAPSASTPSLLICRLVLPITGNCCHAVSHCWAFAFAYLEYPLFPRIPSPLLFLWHSLFLLLRVRSNGISPWKPSAILQAWVGSLLCAPIATGYTSIPMAPSCVDILCFCCPSLLLFAFVGRLSSLFLNLQPHSVTGAQQMLADWVNQWQFIYFLDSNVRKKLLTLSTKKKSVKKKVYVEG